MLAQHFAQGFVHQVGGAVVAHGGGAHGQVDLCSDGIADFEAASRQHAVVTKDVGFDFLGVLNLEFSVKLSRCGADHPLVTHLPTALGVERRGIEHDHPVLTCI